MRKGIVLAGGTGSRLFPATSIVNKHLLPVYDKPMIYYSLSVLMLAGIRDILLISSQRDIAQFQALLRDGRHLGLSISYASQEQPRGIAEAFTIGADFIGEDSVALILGDNIFFGAGLSGKLRDHTDDRDAVVFSYRVKDPSRYGVVEIDAQGRALSIEEKPAHPKSNLAVTGLYFYPNDVIKIARTLTPSARGELEITDVNRIYMDAGRLNVEALSRGYAWLDAGTEAALLEAANFVAAIQTRQDFKIGCLEEIAWRMGWIELDHLIQLGRQIKGSAYGEYITALAEEAQ